MKNRTMLIVLGTIALLIGPGLVGCTPYVNIPAQRGDMAAHSPNKGTVRDVMAAALTHVVTEAGLPKSYAVALPQRANSITYEKVLKRLPEGAVRHGEAEGDLPVFSVGAVYVRGTDAQVDVVAPSGIGASQLVSVYLDLAIDGWWVVRDRAWTIPVSEALDLSFPGEAIE